MSLFHAIYGKGGVGPTPGPTPTPTDLEPVLLWTNPSPNSEFGAQTVTLDLSEYAGVIIEFNDNISDQHIASRIYCKKNDTTVGNNFGGGVGTTVGIARNVTINNTDITFTTGIGNSGAVNPGNLIPVKIYGVKEYVVEPVDGFNVSEATTFNDTINCNIGDYFILMSNTVGGVNDFANLTGGDKLRVFSSTGAYCCICKATSTTISTGIAGSYVKIILNQ